jgi:glycerate kinase
MTSGSNFLMKTLGLAEKIARADLVVTGEGALERQTWGGKVVAKVLEAAEAGGEPVVVVTGSWDGALPAGSKGIFKVLTANDLKGTPGKLSAEDLVELGRHIALECRRLANPTNR